jgi:hypothetical protein
MLLMSSPDERRPPLMSGAIKIEKHEERDARDRDGEDDRCSGPVGPAAHPEELQPAGAAAIARENHVAPSVPRRAGRRCAHVGAATTRALLHCSDRIA